MADVELYKKYRPETLEDVFGQPSAVQALEAMIENEEVPHTLLFTGPSGCGKTTLARILRDVLGAGSDFYEVNSADFRGVEFIRDIRKRMGKAPLNGKCKIWLIDECHQLTKDAQQASLKILEDTPRHVYFFLCTTEPKRLLRTIRTRCTEIKLDSLDAETMEELLQYVCGEEGIELAGEVFEKIVEFAEGSARQALVYLHQVAGIGTVEDQLEAIRPAAEEVTGFKIAQTIINNPHVQWREVASILKACEEDPEGVRRVVLAYARTVLLSGGKKAARAAWVIEAFRDPYYDIGAPGLAASCWEVVTRKG